MDTTLLTLLILAVLLGAGALTVSLCLLRKLGERERHDRTAEYLRELRTDLAAARNDIENAEIRRQMTEEARQRQTDALLRYTRDFGETTERRLNEMRTALENGMDRMQRENSEKLDAMRTTVEEKLEATLESNISRSFRVVSDRLEQVYKGLGEMQSLAAGVGDLKKVLSGVKTRGILGEIQLGAILEELLSPEQYGTNVEIRPGSGERVEFAVRLPGDGDGPVYLPIDSKFPGDVYGALLDAYENASADTVRSAAARLRQELKREASDIRNKYVAPPYSTDFAVMFLHAEGLYAEAVKLGLVDELQRSYRISVAGPSTMAALLNSLQMGFRTLALQKRSSEVWEVLGAVRTEFDRFGEVLERTQKHLDEVHGDLDTLVGVRTRQIRKRLKDIERLEDPERAEALLEE